MALFQDFAGSLTQFMEPAMNKFAEGLLGQIATDYQLNLDEMVAKYLNKEGDTKWAPHAIIDLNAPVDKKVERPPRRKKSIEPATMCEGLTAKGTPCKNKARPEGCLCHIHLRKKEKEESGEPPAPRKAKKTKKVEPAHNHPVGEEPEEPCDVCESHGDVAVGEDDEASFEVDVKARLAAILAGVEGEEEDPSPVSRAHAASQAVGVIVDVVGDVCPSFEVDDDLKARLATILAEEGEEAF